MGLNLSEGLNRLGQGLGTLANHAIIKDQAAREERMQLAQQKMNERLLELREKQFVADSKYRTSDLKLKNTQARTAEAAMNSQIATAKENLSINRAQLAEQRSQNQWQRDQMDAARREQAERESKQLDVQKAEAYNKQVGGVNSRMNELVDKRLEILGEMAADPEARDQQIQILDKEARTLMAERFRADIQFGRIDESKMSESQVRILDYIQETSPSEIDRAGALAAMTMMPKDDLLKLSEAAGLNAEEVAAEIDKAPEYNPFDEGMAEDGQPRNQDPGADDSADVKPTSRRDGPRRAGAKVHNVITEIPYFVWWSSEQLWGSLKWLNNEAAWGIQHAFDFGVGVFLGDEDAQ